MCFDRGRHKWRGGETNGEVGKGGREGGREECFVVRRIDDESDHRPALFIYILCFFYEKDTKEEEEGEEELRGGKNGKEIRESESDAKATEWKKQEQHYAPY